MQWDIYRQCGRHIYSGAYGNNVDTSVFGHIVDCSKFICNIYTDIAASYLHTN